MSMISSANQLTGRAKLVIAVLGALVLCLAARACASPDPRVADAGNAARPLPASSVTAMRVAPRADQPAKSDERLTLHGAAPVGHLTIQVRDLADGSPVTGLGLVDLAADPQANSRAASVVTDLAGLVTIPVAALERMTPTPPYLRAPSQGDAEVTQSAEIWIYREFPVHVTVRSPGGEVIDPARYVAEAWLCPGEPGVLPAKAGRPWNLQWMIEHNLYRHRTSSATGDGTVSATLTAARVRGLTIAVRGAGLRPSFGRVALDGRSDSASVDVVAEPAVSVAGVVQDEDGNPVRGARVVAFVELRLANDQVDLDLYRTLGGAVTWRWAPPDSHGRLTLSSSTTAGADGRFRLDLPASGKTQIVADAPGRRPARTPVLEGGAAAESLELRFSPPPSSKSLVVNAGKRAIAGARVSVFDVSSEVGQRIVARTVADDRGVIDVTMLEAGRTYFVEVAWSGGESVAGSASGYIDFHSQDSIDVESELRTQR